MSNESPKPSGEDLMLLAQSWAMVLATLLIALGRWPGAPR
jgi:hypothetical protein